MADDGGAVQGFESAFAEMIGDDAQCVAVSSGTAALHVALLALNVTAEGEAIVSAV